MRNWIHNKIVIVKKSKVNGSVNHQPTLCGVSIVQMERRTFETFEAILTSWLYSDSMDCGQNNDERNTK